MLKKILITCFFILCFPVFSIEEPIFPEENQVILNKAPTTANYDTIWTPSVEDTKKALNAILIYLENPENHQFEFQKQEIPLILKNFPNYRVQFFGTIINGKKRIYCNFFTESGSFFEWKQEEIIVMDGGYWFWHIEYDMETGQCLNFESNGYS